MALANSFAPPRLPLNSNLVFRSPARRTTMVCESRGDPPLPEERGSWGRKVDEDMIVLRKRIQEKKIADGNHDDGRRREAAAAAAGWTEWERRYYETRYASDVCDAVGVLQNLLLRTRPGVAIGLSGLLVVGLPVLATVEVVVRLVAVAKMVLSCQ